MYIRILVRKLTQTSLSLNNTVWDTHFSAQSRKEENQLEKNIYWITEYYSSLLEKKVKLKSQSQGSSCNCPFNETASGEEIQINSIIENVLLNINQTVQKLHTSIGSTSWAITTNWAFFCSTNLVTVLVPALRVLGFLEGVSSFLATFASALAFSLKN